jgi:hypothetical protein
MSDVAQGALIAGVIGLLNLCIALWFNARTRQRDLDARASERREDNEEWYQRTMFEKRLQAVQEAYEWLMKFNRGLNLADPKNPDAEWTQTLARYCLDAREWYDKNVVFLYDSLPGSSEFIGLMNPAADYAPGRTEHLHVWQFYHQADGEVRELLRKVRVPTAPKAR